MNEPAAALPPLISIITADELALAQAVYTAANRAIDTDEWALLADELRQGRKTAMVAQSATGAPLGYILLNHQPQYAPFRRLGIPELQDLLVTPDARHQGIGAALISFAEDIARQSGATDIGIAFGLDSTYGAAQRLYVRLGYVPDGNGVVYDRTAVPVGALKPLDDLYCLMLLKSLL